MKVVRNFQELCMNYSQIVIVIVMCILVLLYSVYDGRTKITSADYLCTDNVHKFWVKLNFIYAVTNILRVFLLK